MINLKRTSLLSYVKSVNPNQTKGFDMLYYYKQMRIPYHLLIYADKWYASSKTCSYCGFINKQLTLSDRIYKCPCCGITIDRDCNAAINLKKYALDYINKTFSQYGRLFSSI